MIEIEEENTELGKTKSRLSSNQKAMIDALKASGGNVSRAADLVGIGRTTHYLWLEKNEKYVQQVEEVSELILDLTETKLMTNINQGQQRAIEYYLDSKGRARGYGQNKSLTVDVKSPIQVSDVSNETLKEKLQELGIGTEENQLDGKRLDK